MEVYTYDWKYILFSCILLSSKSLTDSQKCIYFQTKIYTLDFYKLVCITIICVNYYILMQLLYWLCILSHLYIVIFAFCWVCTSYSYILLYLYFGAFVLRHLCILLPFIVYVALVCSCIFISLRLYFFNLYFVFSLNFRIFGAWQKMLILLWNTALFVIKFLQDNQVGRITEHYNIQAVERIRFLKWFLYFRSDWGRRNGFAFDGYWIFQIHCICSKYCLFCGFTSISQ